MKVKVAAIVHEYVKSPETSRLIRGAVKNRQQTTLFIRRVWRAERPEAALSSALAHQMGIAGQVTLHDICHPQEVMSSTVPLFPPIAS